MAPLKTVHRIHKLSTSTDSETANSFLSNGKLSTANTDRQTPFSSSSTLSTYSSAISEHLSSSKIWGSLIDSGAKLFAEVKNLKGLDSRFVIVDGKEMMFMLNADDIHEKADSAVWVNSPFFVNSMKTMFDAAWGK